MDEKPRIKKGICNACSVEYDKEIYEIDIDSRFMGYVVQPCSNCGYHPSILESRIYEILRSRFELTINSFGGVSTNHRDLAELVIKHIQENWPKPKRNNE